MKAPGWRKADLAIVEKSKATFLLSTYDFDLRHYLYSMVHKELFLAVLLLSDLGFFLCLLVSTLVYDLTRDSITNNVVTL